jgi:YVTN family beta-propeller protein
MKAKGCRILSVLLCAVFVLSAVKLAGATSTLSPTYTISGVSGNMAYDSGLGAVCVQWGIEYGVVSVILDSNNTVIANVTTVQTNGQNNGLVYDSGKGEIFASSGDGYNLETGLPPTITVIPDSNDSAVATTINAGSFGNSAYNFPYEPTRMAYDSGKNEIFIVDPGAYGSGTVYVMNDSTYTLFASIGGVGNSGGDLVYDSGRGEIFVANEGSNTVSIISDSNNTVVANVTVGSSPYGMAYDSSKGEVFVFNEGDNTVSVINDTSDTVIANVTGVTATPFSTIAYDAGTGMVFAGNAVISDSSNSIIAQLPAGLGDMVYDSGKGEIFAATISGTDVFSNSSIPEYGSTGLLAAAVAATAITICAVAITRRKSKQTAL